MLEQQDVGNEIDAIVSEIEAELIDIRRHLHANPELSLEEFATAEFIESKLAPLGVDKVARFSPTGIAAVIGSGNGTVVGIRGDTDALPIHEESGAPYASTVAGVSHACGHDAHTAIVIGLAHVFTRLRTRLPGRALLVFQPAEEGHGGAAKMIEAGLLEWAKPDAMLGFHNWPPLPPGTVGWHPDVSFSASDKFEVRFKGLSGHAAHPHMTRDPIVAAAAYVTEAQKIISREIAPVHPAVLTFSTIHGGSATNQIPDEVVLTGTMRSQTDQARETLRVSLERIAHAVADIHRMKAEVVIKYGAGITRNDPATLSVLVEASSNAVGSDKIFNLGAGSMGSEDFSEFSRRIPSAHIRIGSKRAGHETMLHRSDFDLDEACIAVAVRCLARAAIGLMKVE